MIYKEGMADLPESSRPRWMESSGLGIELILPEQYFGDRSRDPRSEPPRRLMLAVLEDALLTLVNHVCSRSVHSRRMIAEVELWIASNSRDDLFAFASICDVLGFEPGYLRDTIGRWKRDLATPARYRRPQAGRGRAAPMPARRRHVARGAWE